MKKLEELGISPAPWTIGCAHRCVYDGGDYIVHNEPLLFGLPYDSRKANTRLIAAAPKLYDAAERYLRFHEESCIHGNRSAREILADLHKAFQDLQAALAEAAGEMIK